MIELFCFKSIPQIIFGATAQKEISRKAAHYGSRTLLVTGAKSFVASDAFNQLVVDLDQLQVTYLSESINQEPSPQMIDDIVTRHKGKQFHSVVAIGGGSVLDAGKAISAMLKEDLPVINYLEGVGSQQPSGRKIPFIAVPTTSGTGSETTSNAVLSVVGTRGFKKSLRHDSYIPDVAIVDPELTRNCPPSLTASCGMDCFTQLVEAYLSTNSSPLTDSLALQGITAIARSLLTVVKEGTNLEARSDLAYAAMLSGIVLANAGLGTVHGFASAIGGIIPAAHGNICGTLMEPCNHLTLLRLRQENIEHPALTKYTELGKIFSGAAGKSDAWLQDHFINILGEYTENLKIPDLSTFNISDETIQKIVSETANKYNPIELGENDLKTILRARC
ncbi:iron-containing alcohol dehydrogenase [Desulforhopalus sp. IMCC35007]|uniref:iron-containing alcohol dehydrogenase n=1 Tax=Desulforhopalus sp. IMCC35007 TaxID=2569543 RepID=UPI0010AE8ABC|nr:iron-containing alcohol dehydrogenase [Desulforhopalus sp. IMCC35007]TKB11755.1 iron-containing alcohol dehydrogenase [Desulforhopalus sp. IMCC35007]